MVAAVAPHIDTLPLLYEPDRPNPHGRAQHGWSRTRRIANRIEHVELHRQHRDDWFGAQVQHAIVRYVLGMASRKTLAAELGMSERQVQDYLLGRAWESYGCPVIRALKHLGISTGRGDWQDGGRRAKEVVEASRDVMRRSIDAIEVPSLSPEERERLLSDLYLLTVSMEADS
jgi:hypothetical protein